MKQMLHSKRIAAGLTCRAACGLLIGGTFWAMAGRSEPAAVEKVVVTATRTPKSVLDVPAGVAVIDASDIRAADVVSVEEMLKTVTGVDVLGGGYPGAGVEVSLRGLNTGYQSKRVLVLVDGRRLNEAYQGNADFGLLPAAGIERIEILRGPASALYGSNAMGGVINIVTRRGAALRGGLLRVAAGSHDTLHVRANYGAATGCVDYAVSVGGFDTTGHTDNSDGTDRDWSARNADGNIGWSLDERSELRVFTGAYSGEGADENSDRDTARDYQHAVYRRQWRTERESELAVRAYRNGDRTTYDWKYPGKGVYEQTTLGGEAQQSFWPLAEHRTTLGAEIRCDAIDVDDVQQRYSESTTLVAGYAQDEWFVSEFVEFTLGLRNDRDSDFGEEWSPRVGGLWRPSDACELFVSVNRAHRAPSLSDRYTKVEFNGMRFEGNPDLDPETLMAYEIGARWRPAETLRLEVNLFLNDLRDSFDFILEPDGVFRNRNVTQAGTQGAEVAAEWRLAAFLTAAANYTYTDGEYKEFLAQPEVEGNRLAYLTRNKASLSLRIEPTQRAGGVLACRYVGSRYGDAQNTRENRLDDYVVADISAWWAIQRHTRVTLSVDNVFNVEYEDFPGVEQPGMTILAGLELNL